MNKTTACESGWVDGVGSIEVAVTCAEGDIIRKAKRMTTREFIRAALIISEEGVYTTEALTEALMRVLG